MATLTIRDFPDEIYERLRALAATEHRSIAAQVIHMLDRATSQPIASSILELRGLGKKLWQGTAAADHVLRERDGWA